MKAFDLTDKVAIITGGGSGIGEQMCRVFAEAGAYVQLMEFNAEKGQAVADSISDQGGKVKFRSVDVSNQQQVQASCQEVFAETGRIDILINNAGISHIGKLHETSEADFDRIYQVNIKGVYNCMYGVIPFMMEQKNGVIINMGSVASMVGLPDRFAYSTSKGAVELMTYTVARDYLEYNIRCNSIAPARVHTPFVDNYLKQHYPGQEQEMYEQLSKTQPIGRMAKPVEIANLARYLCSDEASFLTGTNYPIDGGFVNLNT
ncbi:MAG: SDR family oxidoreductase [Saprospiraceae bacterium]|nr:SDR family oxidoreductase [Saprospiraceae bacterium]